MESTESKPDTKNAAREYTNRGWSVVPVPHGEKGPKLDSWQNLRIKAGEVDEYFGGASNIGIQLGEASGGLADVDLDCPEAEHASSSLLPKTLMSGRGSRVTHYWYQSPESRSVKFKDTNGEVIAEIRADAGYQTLVSPSRHPSGELYEWKHEREPLRLAARELRSATARVAVSALIAQHLPESGRHDVALAYAGLMLRPLIELGETKEDATEYVWQILGPAWEYHNADGKSLDDLYECIKGSAEKIEADEPATGGPTLKELLADGEQIVRKIKDWLGWGDLTPEQREQVEQRKRVKRAELAWTDPEVQKIARSYDILDRFRSELKAAGVVGEDRSLKLLFVAGHSRFLDRPISVAVKGPSSAGKSYAVESAITNVQPDDAYIFFTGMSEKALIHSEESYRHKTLIVAEQSGVDSEYQDYLFRTLLSEGKIKYSVTEKVDGRFVVTEKEKEGPTGLITSTTRARLHPENETRILSIHMTDTREQTRAVMRAQASNSKREMDAEPWKRYATWLAGQDNRVYVPYSEALANLIEVYDVRQRRDITLLLNTIKTLALMHQARRARDHQGQIVATLHDYEMARDLLNDLLSQGLGATVSETIRQTVAAVRALTTNGETTNSNAVAKHLNLGKGSVSDRIRNALAEGYIVNLQEPGKKGHKLALGSDLPEDSLLLPEPREVLSATLCNMVRQFGSLRGWTRTAADLPNIVRSIVRPVARTTVSVPNFGKPYDLRERENPVYISQEQKKQGDKTSAESSKSPTPPKPTELPNHVTSSMTNVTKDGGSREVSRSTEPSSRTKVEQVADALLEMGADLTRTPLNLYIDLADAGYITGTTPFKTVTKAIELLRVAA